MLEEQYIRNHIRTALQEDVGQADHSSLACIGPDIQSKAKLVAKEDCVICGMDVARLVFEMVDSDLEYQPLKKDGDIVRKGDIVFRVKGRAISILTSERTVLNYMQRLSGVATNTMEYVRLLSGTNTKLLDTRKTTPTMRILEKYAVKVGGGTNHRMGLYDMIMLKDNHIDFAGGISNAIDKTREYLKKNNLSMKIEIEVRNFDELAQVLEKGGVDRIMLDNFTPTDLKKAVEQINKRYETESSGGINKLTIAEYAKSGVDYISVGALTHHIKSVDLSLQAED
ncbi:MAG TPA: carboxylating nicotinate-nucleotide diphosphorylase [Candidatus Onthomorpha intestinigallinarum]|uniref:Probable nicotinate-nucleotide pyrophosphorylase [carboxylating] n=1 Tax=Candidatus Onthomorpha intestinigallinarum TaxID=2840880 RepID=A0A9D1UHP8_9BACT|nr:carboxylating nicotinate-nucleotide diphosphorylase [Candidatus Onthomorpha intestinigallinarum]